MEKTLLVAGKELPDGSFFAAGAVTSGRKPIITKSTSDENAIAPNGVTGVVWNRPSALSARSLILKSLNEFNHLDECVIFFDEQYFIKKYGDLDSTAENVRVIEELISSYQYLTMEVITRILKKNKTDLVTATSSEKRNLKLIFLYKPNPSISECLINKSTTKPSSPFLSTASSAFKAYAENIAASYAESEEITPILVNCDLSNELSNNDNALSNWLFSYIDTIESLKRPLTAKQKITWVKAGSKSPGGFGFFS